ncbi:MAG: hypothetical protein QOI63_2081 [Thermoplasmata archaeon]|nr:hypothetical protein [Thermoplasmata archaeon]
MSEPAAAITNLVSATEGLREFEVVLEAGAASVVAYRDLEVQISKLSPEARVQAIGLSLRLRKALEAKYGNLLNVYVALKLHAICIHFEGGYFSVTYKRRVEGCDQAYHLMEKAQSLYRQSHRLGGADAALFKQIAYEAATQLLNAMETRALAADSLALQRPAGQAADVSVPEEILKDLEAQVRVAQNRNAKVQYFQGMTAAAIVLPIVVALLLKLMGYLLAYSSVALIGFAVTLAGGMGAVLSAMVRLMDDSTRIDRRVGPFLLRAFGACRPIVGALFGVASYLVIAGHILPWQVPAGAEPTVFYAGVAMLAGFSERWAKDMLFSSAKALSGTSGADETA